MQLILMENVDNLGEMGALVNVKAGYARNYLLPKGLAELATDGKLRKLDHDKRVIQDKLTKRLRESEALADRISLVEAHVKVRVGEDDKIFGSVTTTAIAQSLADQGVEVDRKKIVIEEPIKALGVYNVKVKLGGEVSADVKVWVEKEA